MANAAQHVADVITMPVRTVGNQAAGLASTSVRTFRAWTANEVDLFTYPVRSLTFLHLRRLETAALRRAVTARDSVRELCWAQAFLRARADRFGRLPREAVEYDRGAELKEGLARYIDAQVSGEMAPVSSVSSVAARTARSASEKRPDARQSRTARRSSSGTPSSVATRQCWVHS